MILDSASDDFGCRGRIAVYQHNHLTLLEESASLRMIVVTGDTSPLGIYYQIVLAQEFIGNGNGSMQIATAILLQVKDKRLHPLACQFHQTLTELVVCLGSETTNTDITDAWTNHIGCINRLHWNLITGNDETERIGYASSDNTQANLRTLRTTQTTHNLLFRHRDASYCRIIHIDDTVACNNALFLRRSPYYRLYHQEGVLHHIKLHADTLEVTLQGFISLLHLLRRHVTAMGVQLFYHASDAILHQFLFINTVHIDIGDSHLGNLQFTQRGVVAHVDANLRLDGEGE